MLATTQSGPSSLRTYLAWGVHVFTACGALLGVLALQAVYRDDYAGVFWFLFLSTAVDSVDGILARAVGVEAVLPHIDGRKLDDLVDYLNYVVVPVAFFCHAGMLAGPFLLGLPLIASGLGFSNRQAKTDDNFFLGFPSYWNVLAFYLWKYDPPAPLGTLVITALAVMVLVPIKYLYPTKTAWNRPLTMALTVLWGAQLGYLLLVPQAPEWMLHASLVYPAYYLGASFYLNLRPAS